MEELCKAFVEKGKQDPNWIVKNVIAFLTEYRDRYDRREIAGATIRNYVKPVKLLCEMSDLEIPWKRITRSLPKGRKAADDRAPSIEEIRKLCEYPDRRMKALIYTMCSSGIRLGAWNYLRWEHVSPIEKDGQIVAARLTVYAGEEDQYYAYCTPEAYRALKGWMDYRQTSGESISGKSWIVRDLWATLDPRINGAVCLPRKKKSSGIKRLIENAWYSQALRKPLQDGKTRHEFQAVHGFRKYYKTRCELAGMKPSLIEVSMGHSLGLSDSYFKPRDEEVLQEYLKAVDALTIEEHHNKPSPEDLERQAKLEQNQMDLKAMGRQVVTLVQILNIKDPAERERRLAEESEKWIAEGLYRP